MGQGAFIEQQSARLAALAAAALILLNATASHSSETRLAFLSNSEKGQQPAIEVPTLPPPLEANPFDGRWIFTGGGCQGGGLGIGGDQGRQGYRPGRRRKRNSGRNYPYGRRR